VVAKSSLEGFALVAKNPLKISRPRKERVLMTTADFGLMSFSNKRNFTMGHNL